MNSFKLPTTRQKVQPSCLRNPLVVCLTAALAVSSVTPLTQAMATEADINKTGELRQIELQTGSAVFNYFNGDYFAALTQLAVNDKKGVIDASGKGELLKAGLELHYDMDTDAGRIYAEQLLTKANASVEPGYKDQVYFTFAKALYQKQQYQKAQSALSHVGTQLASQYQDEFYFVSAQTALKLDDVTAAINAKNNINKASIYHRYLAFNHAMALLKHDDKNKALNELEKVIDLNPVVMATDGDDRYVQSIEITDEFEALVDRANLTMGYLYIEQGENTLALAAFKRVSLSSLDSDAAMLGYGWAAMNDKSHQTALAVWQKLSAQPQQTPFVREAIIAIGYAYEQMHDKERAYTAYQQAISSFAKQQQLLDTELAKINANEAATDRATNGNFSENSKAESQYILSLLQPVTANSQQSDPTGMKGPQVELQLPPAINTFDLVASNEFHHGVENVNDLNTAIAQFNLWHSKLADMANSFYGDAAPLNAHGDIAEPQEQSLREAQLAELLRKFREYDARLNQHAFSYMGKLFKADPVLGVRHQLANAYGQYQKLSAQLTAEKANAGQNQQAELAQLQARLDRLAGVLLWQIGDYYLDETGRKTKYEAMNASLNVQQSQQIAMAPVFDLQRRVAAKLATTKGLQQSILTYLQTTLGESLSEQRNDLSNYMQKAQMAIVRLNDDVFIQSSNDESINDGSNANNGEGEL
ncbi:hypothetical protein RI844_06965 [Thalassotalea fonticola]|uniref:Tetratricopeptide repeat protein n=1 Tax=Thalassotalea fonticola TaxID=3065649 RepID=A0ABZ0GUA4_9GAMM|nr:hypothetical protein RI844_06965 [Colwelliaceae bacterium S1-1]